MCLTCIVTPFAGAEVNVIELSSAVYALVDDVVEGYWTTPSNVTKRSCAEQQHYSHYLKK